MLKMCYILVRCGIDSLFRSFKRNFKMCPPRNNESAKKTPQPEQAPPVNTEGGVTYQLKLEFDTMKKFITAAAVGFAVIDVVQPIVSPLLQKLMNKVS